MKYVLTLMILLSATVFGQNKIAFKHLRAYKVVHQSKKIPEGSGLVAWHGRYWVHNDSGEAKLFALDTVHGKIVEEFKLPGTKNTDWEDLSQDQTYFYLGDTGNNSGERSLLNIIRINKESLLKHKPDIDTIAFNWPETENGGKKSTVNFDCEAFVVAGDSIYLFTKEFKTERCTRLFSLPKKPGKYTAVYKDKFYTEVLVTGASYNEKHRQLVLCGYNLWLRPYLLVFPETSPEHFFSGKCIQVKTRLRFRQTEGIDSSNGKNYCVISEAFKFWIFRRKQAMHWLDIGSLVK